MTSPPPMRAAATALFGSGVPKGLIVLFAMLAAVMAAYGAVGYWTTPWAHATSDRSALVGYWQGEMVFEPGDKSHVALHLRKFTTLSDILLDKGGTRGVATPDIRVAAKVCGAKGTTRYHGSGNVSNREGTRFTFGLEPEGGAQGTHPGEFQGVWDGKDHLELTSRMYTRARDGTSVETSIAARPGASENTDTAPNDRVIRFELHRSTEEAFDAAC